MTEYKHPSPCEEEEHWWDAPRAIPNKKKGELEGKVVESMSKSYPDTDGLAHCFYERECVLCGAKQGKWGLRWIVD